MKAAIWLIVTAKRESSVLMVKAGRMKVRWVWRPAVVAVGCMIERFHRDELAGVLPEVDLFLASASEMDLTHDAAASQEKGLIGDAVTLHPGVRVYAWRIARGALSQDPAKAAITAARSARSCSIHATALGPSGSTRRSSARRSRRKTRARAK